MQKTKEMIDYLKYSTKLRVLRYAKDCGKNKEACEVLVKHFFFLVKHFW